MRALDETQLAGVSDSGIPEDCCVSSMLKVQILTLISDAWLAEVSGVFQSTHSSAV